LGGAAVPANGSGALVRSHGNGDRHLPRGQPAARFGAGDSPDAVLGGASVISAVLRSLAFRRGVVGRAAIFMEEGRRNCRAKNCRVKAAGLGRDARRVPPGLAAPHGD
jgi:hypothetical protein